MITVRTQGKLYRFPDDIPQDVMKGAIDKHIMSFQALKGTSAITGKPLEQPPVSHPAKLTEAEIWEQKFQQMTPEERIESQALEANPWVDPTNVAGGALTAGVKAPATLLGKAGVAGSAMLTGSVAEPIVGTIGEKVAEKYPILSLPLGVALGYTSGKLIEQPMLKGMVNAGKTVSEALDYLNKIKSPLLQPLQDEIGSIGKGKVMSEGIDPLLQEARKFKTAEEFVKAKGTAVYHGSWKPLTEIKEFRGGFFASENKELANLYTELRESQKGLIKTKAKTEEGLLRTFEKQHGINKKINEVYVNLKNPLNLTQYKYLPGSIYEPLGQKLSNFLKTTPEKLVKSANEAGFEGSTANQVVDDIYRKIGIFERSRNPNMTQFLGEFVNEDITPRIKNLISNLGYDGIIFNDQALGEFGLILKKGKTYVAFNKSQIKTKSQLTDIWNKAQGKQAVEAVTEKPTKTDIMHLQADIQRLKTALSKAKTKKTAKRINKAIKERETELKELQ